MVQYVQNLRLDTNLVSFKFSFPFILFTNLIICDWKDINGLVNNNLPIQIPEVVVKWITTALVLHIVALVAAALSALFGLLAHVREMSMTCCSTFVSGAAALIALTAFIFDLVLFFVAKARISSVGSAQIGSAIWLTLAAFVLLFFSGCFYRCGKNCIRERPSKTKFGDGDNDKDNKQRLEAVRAEKERQKRQELGLPSMPEYESEYEPLTATIGSTVPGTTEVLIDNPQHGGYVAGASGTRAVDDYYSPNRSQSRSQSSNRQNIYPPNAYPPANTYPPSNYQLNRQLSVPSHPPSVTGYHNPYASYGYTPSPVSTDRSLCKPTCIPSEQSLN